MSCEKSKAVTNLENLAPSFQALGGINDIVKIASEFLGTAVENIPVEELKLDNLNKKLGKFKVSELSDVPSLDITKAIDLKASDLQKIKQIKFSISTPTIEVVKSLNFGVVSIDIKFAISRDGFSWLPVINQGIDTKEKALENLKGLKTKELVNSSNTTLEEAKSLAVQSYKDPRVLKAVESSLTIEDFLNQMSEIGVALFKEVDVESQMRKMIENENAISNSLKDTSPYEDQCGSKNLVPAPFSASEVQELEKDCCNPPVEEPSAVNPSAANALGNFLSDNELDFSFTPEDEAAELDKVNNFLADISSANEVIQNCAKEKANALRDYYLYIETLFNNEISLAYAEARANMISALEGDITVLEKQRATEIQRSQFVKNQENLLYAQTIDRIYPNLLTGATSGTTQTYVLSIGNRKLTQVQRNAIESDVTFLAAVSAIRNEYSKIEQNILNLSSQIENRKTNFALPTFTQSEIQNLQSVALTDSESLLKTKTEFFRSEFLLASNPVTNQVGYDQNKEELKILIHPVLFQEAKAMFALYSPETGDVSDYVSPLISIGTLPLRSGTVATEVWNKYYSQNQVDNLFTYLEQGYKSPKPQYDENGNPLGGKKTINIVGPVGQPVEQEVAESVLNLEVDQEIALEFWPNLEQKTKDKIQILLSQVRNSQVYKDYMLQVKAAGENEAKFAYSVNLIYQENSYTSRVFNSYTNTFSFNQATINNSLIVNLNTNNVAQQFKNLYTVTYDSIRQFQNSIQSKIEEIEAFIETRKQCIADQEELIANKANEFGGGDGNKKAPEKDCMSFLGSDPLGIKEPSGCPGITKNCYWEEYTKLMQIVSLMPIPDPQFLTKRLFRYYPVALQFPVPVPAPVVLPTLASGIPDPLISIPLPIIWKHIVTVSTPAGLFVIWIGLCGPIPGPYVLFFDEKTDPCFLVTPKGPISVPARSLGVTGEEEKSLLEYLPVKNIFKLNLSISPFDKLMGSDSLSLSDPDSPKNIITKIQNKIKNAITSLNEVEPDYKNFSGTPEEIKKKKEKLEKIKKVFDSFPPDVDLINEAFKSVEDLIDKSIDSLKISPIKFPKNPKKLAVPPIGPAEFMDSVSDLIDAGIDVAEAGIGIKFISLKQKAKILIDQKLSEPDVKAKFAEINAEINELENAISIDLSLSAEEKIKARIQKIKKAMKKPLQKVADEITPEMLGFVAFVSVPIPLPVPCYDDLSIPPVPPYVLAILAAVKALPSLIDAIPEDTLADQLSKFVDLSVPLPDIEDIIFFAFKAFSSFLPDLSFPDVASASLIKENVKTAAQNFLKIKIRPPRPGIPQITITESMIKGIIKGAIKAAFAAIVNVITTELAKAIEKSDVQGVAVVLATIKAIFGTDLGSLSGADIKALLASFLESINQDLETLNTLLSSIQVPSIDFKSIKETLFPTIPPKLRDEGPFLEFGTKEILAIAEPLLRTLQNVPIPFPLILLGCTLPPSRLVLSKIYPFSANEPLPSWDKMSLSNVPFVIFLDQLIATAQRQGGIGSDYVVPYYLPDA